MKFGESYAILENGGFVTRESWNDVFIWLKPKANVKSEWCKDPILKMIADSNGGEVEAEQVLCKYSTKDKKVMTGWSPQQDDLAATDWKETKMQLKPMKKAKYTGDLFEGADVYKKP